MIIDPRKPLPDEQKRKWGQELTRGDMPQATEVDVLRARVASLELQVHQLMVWSTSVTHGLKLLGGSIR